MKMPHERLPLEAFLHCPVGKDPGADPELAGGIVYPLWPGNAIESPGGAGSSLGGCLGLPPGPVAFATRWTDRCSRTLMQESNQSILQAH